MLAWRLWHTLKDPPTLHPLFWLTIYRSGANQFALPNPRVEIWIERLTILYLVLLFTSWMLSSMLRAVAQLLMVNLVILLLLLPVLVIIGLILRYSLFYGTFHGALWAVRISHNLAQEREHGRFDLVWLAPPGGLGATMAVCTGCLYRRAAFHRLMTERRFGLWALSFAGIVAILGTQISDDRLAVSPRTLALVEVMVLIAAFYIDAVHSTVLGSLVGMVIPTFSRSSLDARVWALVAFLSLQSTTFLTALLVDLLVMPSLYAAVGVSGWWTELSPPLVSLAVFFLLREGMIRVLWTMLTAQLNADPQDLNFAFRG